MAKKNKVKLPDVKVGQVWIDNDPRTNGSRQIRVLKVSKGVVHAQRIFADGRTGITTKIAQRRFKPTNTGYRLKEVTIDTETKPEFEKLTVSEPVQQPGFGDGKTYENMTVKPVEVLIPVKDIGMQPGFPTEPTADVVTPTQPAPTEPV